MIRTCKDCGLVQKVEKFPISKVVKGKEYHRYLCVPCYYKSKQPRKDAIREAYYLLKKQLSCESCGEDDYRVLEFDHIDKSKKNFSIADGVRNGCGIERIEEEIKKCQVLCANCHRRKTWDTIWGDPN